MTQIAFIRPEGDPVAQVLSSYALAVIANVSALSTLLVQDLVGAQATRANIEQVIGQAEVAVYFGHGQDKQLGRTAALVDTANIGRAKGAVVIAVCCDSSIALGKDAIAQGVDCYVGFDDILVVYHGNTSLFGSVFNVALVDFLGGTIDAKTCHERMIDGFRFLENRYRNDPNYNGHPDAAVIWLASHVNWRGTCLDGNGAATV
jgi:hypothetical protein